MVETRPSRAAAALRLYFRERRKDGGQRSLTKALGCAEGLVSRWCSGERVPDAPQAAFIERTCGIPALWWGEPDTTEPLSGPLLPSSDDSGPQRAMPAADAAAAVERKATGT